MPCHRLTLERAPSAREWLLAWEGATLSLKAPGGETVLEHPTAQVHRILDPYELDANGNASFATDAGRLTFKRDRHAARDLRGLLVGALRGDVAFREAEKRRTRVVITVGLSMFVVCGGLFALYCWWAVGAEDPPKGSTPHSLLVYGGWLIRVLLLVSLGLALAGPYAAFLALRQLRRVWRAERLATSEAVA